MNKRLREVRKKLGMSQQELADVLGVSQGTYSQYERNERVFQPRYIKTLEREFSVNPEWLQNGVGDMFIDEAFEKKVLDIFMSLNDKNQEMMLEFMKELAEKQK